jgi:hypothetical protein
MAVCLVLVLIVSANLANLAVRPRRRAAKRVARAYGPWRLAGDCLPKTSSWPPWAHWRFFPAAWLGRF